MTFQLTNPGFPEKQPAKSVWLSIALMDKSLQITHTHTHTHTQTQIITDIISYAN